MIRRYSREILRGLAYLHLKGVCHRDIKGANILVDVSGTLKVADFGASFSLSEVLPPGQKRPIEGTPYAWLGWFILLFLLTISTPSEAALPPALPLQHKLHLLRHHQVHVASASSRAADTPSDAILLTPLALPLAVRPASWSVSRVDT